MERDAGRRRLAQLMVAGLVDSLCLSVAWTVVMLHVVTAYGLAAAGLCSAAMLVGVAMSAPVAGRLASLLCGRHLLRVAAAAEAVLRVTVFLLILTPAPLWALALCVAAMNVTAWTGYAGMRAEVAAVSTGPKALTWYGTIVAAVEATGIAVGAFLPAPSGSGSDTVLLVVMAVYVLALLPTVVVAGGSPIERGTPRVRRPSRLHVSFSATTVAGSLLMLLASAPTLLAVALAAELHGRAAVAPAAIAFTLGSLAAPALIGRIPPHLTDRLALWIMCAFGMVAWWVLAPAHVALLCVAQLFSGLFMTALEGLLDNAAAVRNPGQVTGALARATAGRAFGSAGGTAILPVLILGVTLPAAAAALSVVLLVAAVPAALLGMRQGRSATTHAGPDVAVLLHPTAAGGTLGVPSALTSVSSPAPPVRVLEVEGQH